jgi:DNA-binding GntR family transcriptional regulator
MRDYAVHMIGMTMHLALLRCSDDDITEGAKLLGVLMDAARADSSPAYVDAGFGLLAHFTRASENIVLIETLKQTTFLVRRNLRGWMCAHTEDCEELFLLLADAIRERDTALTAHLWLRLHGLY